MNLSRLVNLLVILSALVMLASPSYAIPAPPSPSPEYRMFEKINMARHHNGLSRLKWNNTLAYWAEKRSRIMARENRLSHTPDLGGKVCCFKWLAENSGSGPSVKVVHKLFMRSPSHAANILKRGSDQSGVGITKSDGTLWIVEVFRDLRR